MPLHRTIAPALLGSAALLSAMGSAGSAVASCLAEPEGLLWSYPTNGAFDVPLDADLIFTGQLSGLPTLNGAPLRMLERGVYDLGELEPETRYEVRWDSAVIAFETATESARSSVQTFDARELLVTRETADSPGCALVESQGCFDTGPPTSVTLQPPVGSLAWLVDVQYCDGSSRTFIQPGRCGAPVIQSSDPIVCARLRASNGAAIGDATELFCSLPDIPLENLPRSSACNGAWPPEDALTSSSADGISVSGDGSSVPGEPASQPEPRPSAPGASSANETGCALSGGPAASERAGLEVLALAVVAIAGTSRRRRSN